MEVKAVDGGPIVILISLTQDVKKDQSQDHINPRLKSCAWFRCTIFMVFKYTIQN